MATSSSASSIHANCPSGSSFTACNYGVRFLGCCSSTISTNDVCGSGCPSSSLQPLSFDKQYYTEVTDGQCDSSEGKWYSCPDLDPPFVGCCTTNACQNGCPAGGLVPAKLSEDQAQQAPYAPLIEGLISAASTGSSAAATTAAVASSTMALGSTAFASATASPASPTASPSSVRPSTIVGAVIGGVVGGIIISASIAAFLIFYRRWRKNQKQGSRPEADGEPA
ncbi:MAG: hypothetical protein OHK93_004302 [Ramalina farinacea]|uniref:Uncharacterized protein n=1 Tax=Ramalina farinacea TaxID=258253 RepID=A0AA43QI42_9LECA|nr:hypothetical protein [Ramalina farinacea]